MTRYVALLRAVNVGGTGKLAMTDLKAAAEDAGFRDVSTYIASGNCLFSADGSEDTLRPALERAIESRVGLTIGVHLRSAAELQAIIAANPFGDREGAKTIVLFLDKQPAEDAVTTATGRRSEEIVPGARELYVYYPLGAGESRLKFKAAAGGTGRNMNTVRKLATLAAQLK